MSDPLQKLTPRQVTDAGLADWRQVFHVIKARFRTGNFATGLELVNRIGAAADSLGYAWEAVP
ncbi:MAG TPA: 4a-hydroxytetrahydrobiopterin dehydratase, partial [Phycicoccus sp.]|nr:4a-hydroxytetrahydrobiopterin dehydratase [Phycicoccus sp.]